MENKGVNNGVAIKGKTKQEKNQFLSYTAILTNSYSIKRWVVKWLNQLLELVVERQRF